MTSVRTPTPRGLRLLLVPLIIVSVLCSRAPGAHATVAGPPVGLSGTFSGTVRDSDHHPVGGAMVRVVDSAIPPVFTDAKGKYFSPAVTGGRHEVVVTKPCERALDVVVRVDGDTKHGFAFASENLSDGTRLQPPQYFCRVPTFFPLDVTGPLALTGDDASVNVPLPFAFPFYGKLRDNVDVSTNGLLSFSGPNIIFNNTALPTAPGAAIFPFWDDLVVDSEASVTAGTIGFPSGVFVIEWNNVLIRATTNRVSFEVELFDDGEIGVVYRDIGIDPAEHGASATVGVQDDSTGVAMQESFLGSTDIANDSTVQFRADRVPVAKAGPDAIVPLHTDFTLDGSASFDPDDNSSALRFQWSVAGKVVGPTKTGPKVVIDNAGQSIARVHGLDAKHNITFQVVVTDPFGRQAIDFVTVKVQP